jgi:hypothetical protein
MGGEWWTEGRKPPLPPGANRWPQASTNLLLDPSGLLVLREETTHRLEQLVRRERLVQDRDTGRSDAGLGPFVGDVQDWQVGSQSPGFAHQGGAVHDPQAGVADEEIDVLELDHQFQGRRAVISFLGSSSVTIMRQPSDWPCGSDRLILGPGRSRVI